MRVNDVNEYKEEGAVPIVPPRSNFGLSYISRYAGLQALEMLGQREMQKNLQRTDLLHCHFFLGGVRGSFSTPKRKYIITRREIWG
jgi:hypothetical protein